MNLRAEPTRVLVVDDDALLLKTVERSLLRMGFEVMGADSLARARELLSHSSSSSSYDVLLCDFHLGDGTAPELVRSALAAHKAQAAYCMTGDASCATVVAAMRAGCTDVIEKPFETSRIVALLTTHRVAGKGAEDHTGEWRRQFCPQIIGEHPRLLDVIRVIRNVAATSSTVLVTGESGTGKELVARAIHDASPRADKPFVALNCAAIPEALFEAELFGHSRGAFTNAVAAREGHLLAAHGGTLFLDEIGDMPLPAQAKLLRVLQEQRIMPLGSDRAVPINIRVVAATNKDLETAIEAGNFRADLYFRISVIPISLPPLRERTEDIMPLARQFLEQTAAQAQRPVVGFEASAERALCEHGWPGNIRELANTIERAVVLSASGRLTAADLGLSSRRHKTAPQVPVLSLKDTMPDVGEPMTLRLALDSVERKLIEEALEKTRGNRTEAAVLLGLNRTTLIEKIRKFA